MPKAKKKKDSVSKEATTFGRMGGLAVVKKRGRAHMGRIGKKGAKSRWKNTKTKK